MISPKIHEANRRVGHDKQDEIEVKKSPRQTNITEQLHPQDDKTDEHQQQQDQQSQLKHVTGPQDAGPHLWTVPNGVVTLCFHATSSACRLPGTVTLIACRLLGNRYVLGFAIRVYQ